MAGVAMHLIDDAPGIFSQWSIYQGGLTAVITGVYGASNVGEKFAAKER